MAFNQREYDELNKKLAEMRKDDKYKELAEKRRNERKGLKDETENVIQSLSKKGYTKEQIMYICGRVRNVLMNEDEE